MRLTSWMWLTLLMLSVAALLLLAAGVLPAQGAELQVGGALLWSGEKTPLALRMTVPLVEKPDLDLDMMGTSDFLAAGVSMPVSQPVRWLGDWLEWDLSQPTLTLLDSVSVGALVGYTQSKDRVQPGMYARLDLAKWTF